MASKSFMIINRIFEMPIDNEKEQNHFLFFDLFHCNKLYGHYNTNLEILE